MQSRWQATILFALGTSLLPSSALAQPNLLLIDLLPNVYDQSLNMLFSDVDTEGLFLAREGAFDSAGVIVSAFVIGLSSFPLGSSSGGFVHSTDPTTLLPTRTNESFGPAFAERPQTIGRDRSSFGVTFLHRRYDYLEGRKLPDGDVRVRGSVVEGETGPEVGVLISTFYVAIDSYTTTFFATYGVTDRLDLALAVPFERVNMAARVDTALLNRFTDRLLSSGTASNTASASGLGDVAIRGKYNVFRRTPSPDGSVGFDPALAVGADLRVPTGHQDALLGTGNTRLKVYGAASSRFGQLFPHVNLGYTFRSGSQTVGSFHFGPEFSYAAGAEVVLSPRMTFVGDFVGRSLGDEGRLRDSEVDVDILDFYPGERLNLLLGTAGVKFNLRSTFILSAHLLAELNDAGLRSGLTAVVGGDFTFGSRSAGPRR